MKVHLGGGGFDLLRRDGFEVDDADDFAEAVGARRKVFMKCEALPNPGAPIT